MLKLYYMIGSCSLAVHIALREAGLAFEMDELEHGARVTTSGRDYLTVTAKGYVPALELEDGQVLTEGAAILQYIADLAPRASLAPAADTFARVRLQEWLNYVATELHKGFEPLFDARASEDHKAETRAALGKKLAFVEGALANGEFLMGDAFTVADAYLFAVVRWARHKKMPLATWPILEAWYARVLARPAVHAALAAEGLVSRVR